MCGIVGILGREPVAMAMVDALKRLEYRGYDSAGVATLEQGGLTRRRAEGKLKALEQRLIREPLAGTSGIGHTRWATHGRPNEANAHPHATDRVAVVRRSGAVESAKVTVVYVYEGLRRVEVPEAGPGEVVAVAGVEAMDIGETLAEPERPVALPPIHIDEPTVAMLFSSNVSPFAGREGKYVTSRHLRDRLFKEARTNVAIRIDSPTSLIGERTVAPRSSTSAATRSRSSTPQ